MAFFEYIDIFGIQLEWNYNHNTKYKSKLGGLISIICILCLIIFTIFFGEDFFYKLNPKVIGTKVFNLEFPFTSLKSNQGIIAWSLTDVFGNNINYTNIVFPKVIYQTSKLNDNTKEREIIQSEELPLKMCSEVKDIDKILNETYSLNRFYCIDFTGIDFKLGGNWENDILGYIYILIDSCNEDKSSCTTFDEFRSFTPGADNNLMINLIYPDHYFTPINLENPLNYEYKLFYQTIDMNVIKRNHIIFKDVCIEDNIGWIFSEIKKKTIFAFDDINFDIFYRNEKEYNNIHKESNTAIYMMEIYFSKHSYIYKRSFMKLQDLVAVVGGLLKAIIMCFSLVVKLYNKQCYKWDLIDSLFIFSHSNLNSECNRNKINSETLISVRNNYLCKSDMEININRGRNIENDKNQNSNFDKHKNKINNLFNKNKYKFYFENLITRRLDLKTYITGTFLFDYLVDIVLDQEQKMFFKYNGKYNLSNTNLLKLIDEGVYGKIVEKKEVDNYLKMKIQNNHLTEIDKKIIYYHNMLN